MELSWQTAVGVGRTKRVLIIDDNQACSLVARQIFFAMGAHADTVANGYDAVEAVAKERYDLVLVDWQMPIRDGAKTLQLMDAVVSNFDRRIPYIIYTGQDPDIVSVPHTENLYIIDYWHKEYRRSSWEKRVAAFFSYQED
ncbi:MAG: hypothetical protein CL677_05625 [Bdellovibrionaceae bacterium]|nr:hypothetical protein [Pseudobdellovibrionaceae bacterium]|tara:strand:+ start:11377 stop:11799 length:423 start_codon:yes stop_codon:yes gene_type:complete